MCLFIPFGKIDIYFEWKSYFCGLDAPIKVVCSIVSMMMVTFMAIDRLMVSSIFEQLRRFLNNFVQNGLFCDFGF